MRELELRLRRGQACSRCGATERELETCTARRGAPGGDTHGRRATDLSGLGLRVTDLLRIRFVPSSHCRFNHGRVVLPLPQACAVGDGNSGQPRKGTLCSGCGRQ